MLPSDQHPKQTPGRRRPSRNNARAAGYKSYASENDMPANQAFQPDFVRGGPATPQKSTPGSPAPGSMAVNSKSAKRNSARSRPKNVSTSPGPQKSGRRTPPQTAGPKPPAAGAQAAAAAFAGATFHASPAPSSLPIPSFMAKTTPDSPARQGSGMASQEPSPPASDSEAATPARQPFASLAVAREESPLDIFFRADRAEKERARRASSANVLSTGPGPFSPPLQNRSPQENHTFPRGGPDGGQPTRRPGYQRNSSLGIPTAELDGTPGLPIGPSFSTPYHERIKAARSNENQAQSQQASRVVMPQYQQQQQQQQPQQPPLSAADKTDALKRFLFGSRPSPASTPSRAASDQPLNPAMPQVHELPAAAATTAQPSEPENLRAMEDKIRQMLKLES